jgi:hypothetical protein
MTIGLNLEDGKDGWSIAIETGVNIGVCVGTGCRESVEQRELVAESEASSESVFEMVAAQFVSSEAVMEGVAAQFVS